MTRTKRLLLILFAIVIGYAIGWVTHALWDAPPACKYDPYLTPKADRGGVDDCGNQK